MALKTFGIIAIDFNIAGRCAHLARCCVKEILSADFILYIILKI